MLNLSIVIPYHNNKEQLNRLLDSIPDISQIEVIIVDDHSNISLDDFNRSNIIYIRQMEGKRWAGAARNTGLQHASRDYVIFADSDDFFVEGAFNIIEQYLGKDDLVFFKPTSIKDDGTPSNRHLLYEDIVSLYFEKGATDILYKFHVPWSKVYKRSYLKENNILFDEVVASNDVVFSIKSSLLASSFSVVDRIVYCVVESSNSLTKKRHEHIIDSRFEALSRYNDFLIERNDEHLAAMSGHLKNALYFGFSKFMYRLFFCINKGYPLFYNISHLFRAMRYIKARNRG